jgi:hypothetical protein
MQLYSYIYISKNRIQSIRPEKFRVLKKISENKRMFFAMVLAFIIILSPMFIFIFFIPFGVNR